MSNAVAPRAATAAPAAGRLRLKALMTSHLRPLEVAVRWEDELSLVDKYGARYGRDSEGTLFVLRQDCEPSRRRDALGAAVDIRDALPDGPAMSDALAMMQSALRAPFDETSVRLLIGVMLDGFRAKPGESAAVYLDAMIWQLEELRAYRADIVAPTAAIAAAIRQVWSTQTFPPAIAEFLPVVRKHWAKLVADFQAIQAMSRFAHNLDEVIEVAENETTINGDPDAPPF